MKVKFSKWDFVINGYCVNDEDVDIFDVNEGVWYFEIDGKEYSWKVSRQEYLEEDESGKQYGFLIIDMNDNSKVLYDSRWIGWFHEVEDFSTTNEVEEKFNDEMSCKDLVFKIWDYLYENVKVDEYTVLDIFRCSIMDKDGGKEKVIGLEFEI